jgi:hypothetical protein
MTLKVIGAGLGRTGTLSLKAVLNELGFGPCHHMGDVMRNTATQVPLWRDAVAGRPDWSTVFDGYPSAVDWPAASFYRELHTFHADAKFVLTVRSSQSWAESFSETIYKNIADPSKVPPFMQDWLKVVQALLEKTGVPVGLGVEQLKRAFDAHTEAVKAAIPPSQLLVYEVKQGWEPLCEFLEVPVPRSPFPRTNDRATYWERWNTRFKT